MRGLATPRGRRPSRPIRCAPQPFGIALGHMRRPRGPARHPSAPTSLVPRRRAPWPRRAVLLVLVVAGWVAAGTLRAQAPYGDDHARGAALDPANLVIPDDVALFEQLERAVDLRRREDFDRMLDARDPGELVEHATISEPALDRKVLGVDALFIAGDELFNYQFRPENGWGSGGADRTATGYTPRLRRVHLGAAGGPDAFACFGCHSKGGPDGAGTQTQNAFMRGDGKRTSGADQRNPPQVLGLGPIACLAREMGVELRAQADAVRERAKAEGRRIEGPLVAKGVSFGRIAATPDGTLDLAGVEGVDSDLTIRPFGWKGHQATLRGMAEESLHIHQGLLSNRIQLAVGDGSLDAGPYGKGPWYDVDEDGVSAEINSRHADDRGGLPRPARGADHAPATRPGPARRMGGREVALRGHRMRRVPHPHARADGHQARRARGSGSDPTHVRHRRREGWRRPEDRAEVRRVGHALPGASLQRSEAPRHGRGIGDAGAAGRDSRARVFLTRPLWGLAETAPYLHDGRAPTVHDAIVMHGGEATAARDAYLALDEQGRASIRVFLTSLAREPKLFVP